MSKVKLTYLAIAMIMLLGIVSRFLNISAQGIKVDETWVVPTPNFHFQSTSIYPKLFEYQQYRELPPLLQNILRTVYHSHPVFQIVLIRAVSDVHPPLFFILNYYASRWLGYDLWAIRTPAAIYWILAAFTLLFLLFAQGFETKTVILSVFFVVISPFYLFLSNYARPYTLLLLINLISCCLAYKLYSEGYSRRRVLLYILTCIASLYTHYYALFVVIAQAGFLAIESRRRGSLRRDARVLCIIYASIGIAFLPWAAIILLQMKWRYAGIEMAGSLRYLRLTALLELILFFGPAYSRSTVHSTLNWAASLIQFGLVAAGVHSMWRTRDNSVSRFWLVMLIVPLALAAIPNNIKPLFSPRNFSIVLIPYFVVCAVGLCSLRGRLLKAIPILGIGAVGSYFMLYGLAYGNVRGEKALEDWRGVAAYIQTHYLAEQRIVYVYHPAFRDALYYHMPSPDVIRALDDETAKTGPREEVFLLVIVNHVLDPDESNVRKQVPFLSSPDTLKVTRLTDIGGAYIYDVQMRHRPEARPMPPLQVPSEAFTH
jgi:uncharacterized membrane protein